MVVEEARPCYWTCGIPTAWRFWELLLYNSRQRLAAFLESEERVRCFSLVVQSIVQVGNMQ